MTLNSSFSHLTFQLVTLFDVCIRHFCTQRHLYDSKGFLNYEAPIASFCIRVKNVHCADTNATNEKYSISNLKDLFFATQPFTKQGSNDLNDKLLFIHRPVKSI